MGEGSRVGGTGVSEASRVGGTRVGDGSVVGGAGVGDDSRFGEGTSVGCPCVVVSTTVTTSGVGGGKVLVGDFVANPHANDINTNELMNIRKQVLQVR
jgi:hypothetical protein